VFSSVATGVDLCLLIDGEEHRMPLPMRTRHVWHGHVAGIGPGTEYGFRVHGPWQPDAGLRCNPNKLLLDPYARQIRGDRANGVGPLAYVPGAEHEASQEDSAADVPHSVVVDPSFDWEGDRRLRRPWKDTIFYEAHLRALTMRHPEVPDDLRGTYAGLTHPAILHHLTSLGVTAVELLPVHAFIHDGTLIDRGLCNYWGYNTVGFFAPHTAYASAAGRTDPVREFKQMVKALHAAGIEVILDVVYNHTAEGNHLGPTLCFRGLDNQAYYHLVDGDPQHYMDYTGIGNSVSLRHPQVVRLVMDSLRYWVSDMHVDGFRFDLAVTLGRAMGQFDGWSSFFAAVQQDPVLRDAKLVAEPWDIGDNGYRAGGFAIDWAEWNGRFRDTARDFWRSQRGSLPEFAARVAGSADVFAGSGRAPQASVNLVVVHDGFTLEDLVSYNDKHNEANGEDNRDGESPSNAWNLGVEGPTDDPTILGRRGRQKRNLLATLLLSQGTPLIAHGDELGRTQRGNNNAYCQDNEITWIDWGHRDRDLEAFVAKLTAIRRDHPVLRSIRWLSGELAPDNPGPVAQWFRPDGARMQPEDWENAEMTAVTLVLEPENAAEPALCFMFCATLEPATFVWPAGRGKHWHAVVDTASSADMPLERGKAGEAITRPDLSLMVAESEP
jgi:glycogen operon protein